MDSTLSEDLSMTDILSMIQADLGENSENKMSMNSTGSGTKPYIEIVEQPKARVRFRYECEGRSAGSILGISSRNDSKTHPAIRIRNYEGAVIICVSCVTEEPPYRPHPHKLVGKDSNCQGGIFHKMCNVKLDETIELVGLGIQCMKKKDIRTSLEEREQKKVDPFKTGYFPKKNEPINLNCVRLCFQVFIPSSNADSKDFYVLRPIVSEPILDAKSNSDLVIHTLSHSSAPVTGSMQMILLCEKVTKEDIRIRFFQEENGKLIWEGYGEFTPSQVHKQYAIVFKTPRYITIEINDPIPVKVQLVNSKKGTFSEPLDFLLLPLNSGRNFLFPDFGKFQNLAPVCTFPRTLLRPEVLKLETNKILDAVSNTTDYASVEKLRLKSNPGVEETARFPALFGDVHNTLDNHNDADVNGNLVHTQEKQVFSFSANSMDITSFDDTSLLQEPPASDIEVLQNVPEVFREHLPRTEGYGSYSSLQFALKNPYFHAQNNGECYEDVLPPDEIPPPPQQPSLSPPRPPSHTKPDLDSLQKSVQAKSIPPCVEDNSIPPLPPRRRGARSGIDKRLPSTPKRKTILSKLLPFKKSKSKPSTPRERSLSVELRGSSINDDIMMTEAEHYALYMSNAPRATHSEFDEDSFAYSPVERLTAK